MYISNYTLSELFTYSRTEALNSIRNVNLKRLYPLCSGNQGTLVEENRTVTGNPGCVERGEK
jgi:hypothetical protein